MKGRLHFLPWTAAISVGALGGAGILSVFLDFRAVYPNALGLGALVVLLAVCVAFVGVPAAALVSAAFVQCMRTRTRAGRIVAGSFAFGVPNLLLVGIVLPNMRFGILAMPVVIILAPSRRCSARWACRSSR